MYAIKNFKSKKEFKETVPNIIYNFISPMFASAMLDNAIIT